MPKIDVKFLEKQLKGRFKVVVLTLELLNAGRTDRGGFTSAQYKALGAKPLGTKLSDLVGREVTAEAYQDFLSAREVRVALTPRKMKRYAKLEERRLAKSTSRERIIDFASL